MVVMVDVILLLFLFFLMLNEQYWCQCSPGEEPGVSSMQVCEQLMEVTAKMTYNHGVEK